MVRPYSTAHRFSPTHSPFSAASLTSPIGSSGSSFSTTKRRPRNSTRCASTSQGDVARSAPTTTPRAMAVRSGTFSLAYSNERVGCSSISVGALIPTKWIPSMSALSRGAWRFAASADGRGEGGVYAGRGPDESFDTRCLLRRKFTMPRAIGYSLWHTGQPTRPERTMRSFTSPVESTSISSRCGSGQRSISVSSMCTRGRASCVVRRAWSWPEFDPTEFPHFDFDPAKHALPADFDAKHVRSRWHVGDAEVLVIDGIGVIARAVRLDERERRLVRLGLHEAVDACLVDGLAGRIPHLPRDHSCAGERIDPQLRVRVVRRIAHVGIDDQARRVER